MVNRVTNHSRIELIQVVHRFIRKRVPNDCTPHKPQHASSSKEIPDPMCRFTATFLLAPSGLYSSAGSTQPSSSCRSLWRTLNVTFRLTHPFILDLLTLLTPASTLNKA